LNSRQPKGCFYQIVKKSREFYALKNVLKKKKPIAVFKKKKREIVPASTADPKKVKKVDFDFYQIFFDFCVRLLKVVRKFTRLTAQSYGPKPNGSF
jgi:hypothetical protein